MGAQGPLGRAPFEAVLGGLHKEEDSLSRATTGALDTANSAVDMVKGALDESMSGLPPQTMHAEPAPRQEALTQAKTGSNGAAPSAQKRAPGDRPAQPGGLSPGDSVSESRKHVPGFEAHSVSPAKGEAVADPYQEYLDARGDTEFVPGMDLYGEVQQRQKQERQQMGRPLVQRPCEEKTPHTTPAKEELMRGAESSTQSSLPVEAASAAMQLWQRYSSDPSTKIMVEVLDSSSGSSGSRWVQARPIEFRNDPETGEELFLVSYLWRAPGANPEYFEEEVGGPRIRMMTPRLGRVSFDIT